MDIRAYLKKHGLSQQDFADMFGVTQSAVWQWMNGERSRVTAERAIEIERVTRGQIRRQDLRPDLFSRRAA